ncbi:MAG TPA: redoxin domain-containing protein [Candidatus Cybelea sp.]|jgi:thiol-disulfide isomerase/thioredoxin|nr:redoxin domain-containing protein [Candidatus Cybelea sp.]
MRWRAFLPAAGFAAVFTVASAAHGAQTTLDPLDSARGWINGRATASSLRGQVVVVDIFTVDCSNCQNVVPTLRSLYAADRGLGLRIVGVHAPETPAERTRPYVEAALVRQGVVWPVAIDNDFTLWRAFGASAWPTELFFDREGHLRKAIVGDSQDDEVRATVARLLAG